MQINGHSSASFGGGVRLFDHKTQQMFDGLANLMSGSGSSIDKRSGAVWLRQIMVDQEIETAYRGSWLLRKIIDLPAYDMTREHREWQASADQIEKLEAEEKRLCVWEKLMQAIVMGRLGGGAIILGTGDDPATELDPERIGKGGLKYLYVVHKSALSPGDMEIDPMSEQFGEPATFELTLPGRSQKITIHYSRMLIFKGQYTGKLSPWARNDYWGDPLVASLLEPVNNATTVQNEFVSLIQEAKIDVFKIPKLMGQVGSQDYESRFLRRLELANVGKSNHRALIMDSEEEWDQRELNLRNWAEFVKTTIGIVAGAADIPATRLLGKSPDGMNATGDSDQANYEQMITTKQENELRPKLEKLDLLLIPSALGMTPPEVSWEFGPLSVLSESDQAVTENKEADTLSKLVATGLFQDEALEVAFSNRMIESGRWPGYDEAREEALESAEEPTDDDIEGVTNPPAPGTQPANQPPQTQGATQ